MHPAAEATVSRRPERQVEVIGHDTVSQNAWGVAVWPLTTARQMPESRRLDERHRLDCCPGSRCGSRRSPLRRVRFAASWTRSPATMIGTPMPHLIQPAITIHYAPLAPPMSPSPLRLTSLTARRITLDVESWLS